MFVSETMVTSPNGVMGSLTAASVASASAIIMFPFQLTTIASNGTKLPGYRNLSTHSPYAWLMDFIEAGVPQQGSPYDNRYEGTHVMHFLMYRPNLYHIII